MTKAEQKEQERQEAKKWLLDYIKPGDTIHTVIRHVSRSGMMRHIDVVLLREEGALYMSYHVAKLLDYNTAEDGSLKVGGCGMDMGFHVVYALSSVLFAGQERAGYILNQRWL